MKGGGIGMKASVSPPQPHRAAEATPAEATQRGPRGRRQPAAKGFAMKGAAWEA